MQPDNSKNIENLDTFKIKIKNENQKIVLVGYVKFTLQFSLKKT